MSLTGHLDITLSAMPKTWLFDLDGTLLVHNGHLDGKDSVLPGTREFFDAHVGPDDVVILLTAREERYRAVTEQTLRSAGLRFDQLLFGLPKGERICVNDAKPKGLHTAVAINLPRDAGLGGVKIVMDATI
jgi:FMN phosphatase YigB (HAD superfamily)